MTWLRIDDRFAQHPKVTLLTYKERWVWMRLLCYCARYKTEGQLAPEQVVEIPGLTPRLCEKLVDVDLFDVPVGGIYQVHDWAEYAPKDPTAAERQQRFRHRHSHASRNGSLRDEGVTETVPRVRAGAHKPVPSVSQNPSVPGMNYDPAIGEAEARPADSGGREAEPERSGDFERIDPAAELRRTLEKQRA